MNLIVAWQTCRGAEGQAPHLGVVGLMAEHFRGHVPVAACLTRQLVPVCITQSPLHPLDITMRMHTEWVLCAFKRRL